MFFFYIIFKSTVDEEQDTWDSPLQWRQSILQEMKLKDYNPIRSKTPTFQKQKISEQHIITVPYNRDPSVTIKTLPSLDEEKIRSRTSSQTMIREHNLFSNTEIKLGPSATKPSVNIQRPKSPALILPKNGDKNFEGANQDFEFIRSPISPTARLRKTGNPIAELESKGKKNIDRINEDDPPFNFQGMLRKTNFKRDSMKKIEENVNETPYTNVLRQTYQKPVEMCADINKEFDNIRCELAPGIYLEGTEAAL